MLAIEIVIGILGMLWMVAIGLLIVSDLTAKTPALKSRPDGPPPP